MARTESISIQVYPNDEQSQINLMQRFWWSLLSSQEIKTVDNSVQIRGDSRYYVRTTEHYVKLVFSRDPDLPSLDHVRRIESEFFSLQLKEEPALFPGSAIVWIVFCVIWGIGIIAWVLYYKFTYEPQKKEALANNADVLERRSQLLAQLDGIPFPSNASRS